MIMKKGDKAKVISNDFSGHAFKIGSIVKLKEPHEKQKAWYCKKWFWGLKQVLHEKELEAL